MPRIMVTNDDGMSSIGLHVLARAMRVHGDVVIIAPDSEYSGASASLGALHLIQPQAKKSTVDGIDEAWCINGPPALCTVFARFGVFGPIDLVVSGINPGANVGRAIYHSGTVGAALTARNGGLSGVAVSQAVAGFGIEGQGWDEMIIDQQWESAAEVASVVVGEILAAPPAEPIVANINVPNLPINEIKGWRHATVGSAPPRALASARLDPIQGQAGCFSIRMELGDTVDSPPDTDSGAIERDEVTLTYISRLHPEPQPGLGAVDHALDNLLTTAGQS